MPFFSDFFFNTFPPVGANSSGIMLSGKDTSSYGASSIFASSANSFFTSSSVGSSFRSEPKNQINVLLVFQEFTQALISATVI